MKIYRAIYAVKEIQFVLKTITIPKSIHQYKSSNFTSSIKRFSCYNVSRSRLNAKSYTLDSICRACIYLYTYTTWQTLLAHIQSQALLLINQVGYVRTPEVCSLRAFSFRACKRSASIFITARSATTSSLLHHTILSLLASG